MAAAISRRDDQRSKLDITRFSDGVLCDCTRVTMDGSLCELLDWDQSYTSDAARSVLLGSFWN